MSESVWDDSMRHFRERVAAATPTPGGGAVAAVSAAFAAALLRMVCGISLRSASNSQRESIEALASNVQRCEEALAGCADEDVRAFDAYMRARREGAADESQSLLLDCARVPMAGAETVGELRSLVREIEAACPAFAKSDLATASFLLRASGEALLANVKINLDALLDGVEKGQVKARYERLAKFKKAPEADSLRE